MTGVPADGVALLRGDSFRTTLRTYLLAILLGGLTPNRAFALWWADPVAALAMVPIFTGEAPGATRCERCGDRGAVCADG